MVMTRNVSLNLSDGEQVLTIPREFALSGTEVLLRKEGDRLIIDLIPPISLLATLESLPTITDFFPDIDSNLIPLDEIIL